MKVLQVIPNLDSRSGGPVKALQGLSEKLAERGIQVTIFTTQNGHKAPPISISSEVKCEIFPSYGPGRFAFSPSFEKAVRKVIKQFDLVHIHTLWSFPVGVAGHYCRKFNVPYLVRPCGMLAPLSLSHKPFRKKIYSFLIERKNLNEAKAVHFATSAEKDLSSVFDLKTKAVVIPLGINQRDYADLPPRGEFRKKHTDLIGKKIILFLGRIVARKGIHLLVDAFSHVVQTVKDAHLVIAGPDDERLAEELKRRFHQQNLNHHVTLPGFLQGREKLALFRDSDIFCLPSYYENFGVAVIEAMAAGLPVVISDQVNISSEVQKKCAGIVVPCQAEPIASAFRRLLEDGELRKTMGQNGQKLVYEKYQWDVIVDEVIKLYESAARSH